MTAVSGTQCVCIGGGLLTSRRHQIQVSRRAMFVGTDKTRRYKNLLLFERGSTLRGIEKARTSRATNSRYRRGAVFDGESAMARCSKMPRRQDRLNVRGSADTVSRKKRRERDFRQAAPCEQTASRRRTTRCLQAPGTGLGHGCPK